MRNQSQKLFKGEFIMLMSRKSWLVGLFVFIGVTSFLGNSYSKNLNAAATTTFSGVTTWHIETIDTQSRGNSSIVVASNDYPAISYEADGVSNQELKYARWTGTQWTKETVGSMGLGSADTSLTLDSNEYPHISYASCNPYYCPAKYSEWTGGSWTTEDTLDGYGSLIIDTNDNSHISYKHGNFVGQTSLRYMYTSGSSWITTTVDTDPITNRNTSLKLDGNEYPHISYYKQDAIKYALWNGASWVTQVVDSATAIQYSVGQHTSLALDTNDHAHIVYYDGTNEDLKYATWNGVDWSISTVDSYGDVGKYASLVLDSSGFPHIIYYDATNHSYKYAFQVNQVWLTTTIESDVGDGDTISLTIDSNDKLHLSY
jgi:hypothetical protein